MAGLYETKLKDVNGCLSATKPITITQPTLITFSATKQDVTCASATSGVIGITLVGGGTPAYTYSKNATLTSGTYATTNPFTNLAVGVYPIRVKDSKGCFSEIQNVEILNGCVQSMAQMSNGQNPRLPTVLLNIYPNPNTEGTVNIELNSPVEQEETFQFLDVLGKTIIIEKRVLYQGIQRIMLDCSALPKGIYQIVITSRDAKSLSTRFVKL